jgi:hypothetical protein
MVGASIAVDEKSLREVLLMTKEVAPRLATKLRRDLRSSGDTIIAAQRALLDGELPAGIQKTGQVHKIATNKKTGKLIIRKSNTYGDKAVSKAGRTTGLREGIKAGLVTRVKTGAKSQSVTIQAQRKIGVGSNFYQSKLFRHPVFGQPGAFAYQRGMPYFFAPIYDNQIAMREAITKSLNDAVAEAILLKG